MIDNRNMVKAQIIHLIHCYRRTVRRDQTVTTTETTSSPPSDISIRMGALHITITTINNILGRSHQNENMQMERMQMGLMNMEVESMQMGALMNMLMAADFPHKLKELPLYRENMYTMTW